MPSSRTRDRQNTRRQHCSSRVKVTIAGGRGSFIRRTGITAEESASAKTAASREYKAELRRRIAGLKALQREDEVRMNAPGGLKETDARFTAEDERLQLFYEQELADGEMEEANGDGPCTYSSIDGFGECNEEWESEDEDEDEGVESTRMQMAMMEKEAAVLEQRTQMTRERNRFYTRFRTQTQSRRWGEIYEQVTIALMKWEAEGAPSVESIGETHTEVVCISWEGRVKRAFEKDNSKTLAETMVENGFMPTVPVFPSLGIAISVLIMYDTLSQRSPTLSIQAFAHSWCDNHAITYEDHFGHSFSGAFDAYMEIRHRINKAIDTKLYANSLERYRDICPSCIHRVPEEPKLKYSMLVSIDGNESLKRVKRQKEVSHGDGSTEMVSTERPDTRHRHQATVIEQEEVNLMKDEVKSNAKKQKGRRDEAGDEEGRADGDMDEAGNMGERTMCEEKWANLSPDHKNTWGTFEESGIFICACRHGCVLLRCDMVRSGELAKYPLAIVNRLIDVFGSDILCGYDIGCGFSVTANRSKSLADKVKSSSFRFCCGSFHGYAHNRRCQLQWHPLYIPGTGIEDFKTCERVFSESNKVAPVTRNASVFHRRQWLDRFFERFNRDKFSEQSKFIAKNFSQAQEIIAELEPKLARAKDMLGIEDDREFEAMRQDELEFLEQRQQMKTPEREGKEMEYLQTLRSLDLCSTKFFERYEKLRELHDGPVSQGRVTKKMTMEIRRLEKKQTEAADETAVLSQQARYLEERLGIHERWRMQHPDWIRVSKRLDEDEYCKALDRVEGLVVARLHELTKMNKAGTGVRLRVQIAKALQTRSRAVTSAIGKLNAAGRKLGRDPLEVKSVLKFASLGEFDLLRLSRHDIMSKPWANQSARDAQIMFLKLQRAREEILRLNVEARRLHDHIFDWARRHQHLYEELCVDQPLLAFQLQRRVRLRMAQCDRHLRRLRKMECLPGFTGTHGVNGDEAGMEQIRRVFEQVGKHGKVPDRGQKRAEDDAEEEELLHEAEDTDDVLQILAGIPEDGLVNPIVDD